MSTINTLGPVGFNPTGEYDNTHKYERLDVVYYEGSSYVALQDSIGQLPTNTDYWDCIAVGYLKQNTYDSVAEMKADDTLKAGMYAQTVGYYEVNDGGGATYRIREKIISDVIDEGSIIEINESLIAELIVENNTINTKQFGAVGDGVTDDTSKIQALFNYAKNNTPMIIFINGLHYIDGELDLKGENNNRLKNITITGVDGTRAYYYIESLKYGFIFNAGYDFNNRKSGIILDYVQGINIQNLQLKTNEVVDVGEIPLNSNHGIKISHSSDITIKNCNITKFFKGIFSDGLSLSYFNQNNISLCNIGIQLNESGDSMLVDNYINTIGSNIYDLSGILNSKYNSLYTNNVLYAIGIYVGGSGNMTIKGGKIEWCAIGIWQDYTTNMIYDGIQFDRCNACGIGITGHNNLINRTLISNNNFTGCGGTSIASANQDKHLGGLVGTCIGSSASFGLLITNNKFYGDNGELKGSFKSGQTYYGPIRAIKFDRVYNSSFLNNIVEIDTTNAYEFTNSEVEFDDNITNKYMYMGENVVIYRQAGIKREFFHNNPSNMTIGNFDVGDIVYNHNDLSTKWKVTTAGTAETISKNVSVVTTATNYYPGDKTVIDLGTSFVNGARTGAYITIAGVSGTKKIIGVIKINNHYYAKLDSACDVAVSNATMTNVTPVFTQL